MTARRRCRVATSVAESAATPAARSLARLPPASASWAAATPAAGCVGKPAQWCARCPPSPIASGTRSTASRACATSPRPTSREGVPPKPCSSAVFADISAPSSAVS
eukprot:15792731-Heterocapsa_arctica.AAC.1